MVKNAAIYIRFDQSSIYRFCFLQLLVDHFCGGMLYSPSATSGGGGPNIDINQVPKHGKEKKQSMFSGIGHLPFNGPMTKQFFPISMTMEISPIHHNVVLGKVSTVLLGK